MFPFVAAYVVQFSHLMTSYFQSENGKRDSGSLFEVDKVLVGAKMEFPQA